MADVNKKKNELAKKISARSMSNIDRRLSNTSGRMAQMQRALAMSPKGRVGEEIMRRK